MSKNKIRAFSLALCLLCALALLQPISATTQIDPDSSAFTYTTLVHNRARKSSAVIGQMENHSSVTVLEDCGDFYKVDCYDMTGYIAKEQIVLKRDGKYYIQCNLQSDDTAKMEVSSLSNVLLLRASIMALADKQLGTRYVYGGSQPGGFDCSGFVYYVYGQHDYSLDRCADEQLQNGIIVAKEGMQIGDLVFFRESGTYDLTSHVGIYAGNNQVLHASRWGICYSDLDDSYYRDFYLCARRVINADSAEIQIAPAAATEKSAARSRSIGFRTAG